MKTYKISLLLLSLFLLVQTKSFSQPFAILQSNADPTSRSIAGIISDDEVDLFSNPYGLFRTDKKISVSYSYNSLKNKKSSPSSLHVLSGGAKLYSKGVVFGGMKYFGATDASNNPQKRSKMTLHDYLIDIGYVHSFSRNILADLNFGYLYKGITNRRSYAFPTFSIGVLYRNRLTKNMNYLLNARVDNISASIGGKKKQLQIPSSLGLRGTLGYDINSLHAVRLGFNSQYFYNYTNSIYSDFRMGLGAEYIFKNFIFLRTGYTFVRNPRKIKANNDVFACGFGVLYRQIAFNIAWDNAHLSNVFSLGVSYRF